MSVIKSHSTAVRSGPTPASASPPTRRPRPRQKRTAEIVAHVQSMMEAERIAISRELHDDMGGLMVSAVMDLAWAEQHLDSIEDARTRLLRVRQTLAAVIDLKRTMIERLRPSLLDNFGLFATFRWHIKRACEQAGVACTERYPVMEPALSPEALTGLFRIMQEALSLMFAQSIKVLDVSVSVGEETLTMRLAEGDGSSRTRATASAARAFMEHRVRALGGRTTLRLGAGGIVLTIRFPLAGLLARD